MTSIIPDIQKVKEYSDIHPNYIDTYAATTYLGQTCKETITMGRNPFCKEFEYGASSKGCYNYDHFCLQIEEFANILKYIHPGIDFIFLFYHSYGHGIKRGCGLNVTNMNSVYGGDKEKCTQQISSNNLATLVVMSNLLR